LWVAGCSGDQSSGANVGAGGRDRGGSGFYCTDIDYVRYGDPWCVAILMSSIASVAGAKNAWHVRSEKIV